MADDPYLLELATNLARAFEAGDAVRIGTLLSEDATAVVLGAPFPEEVGREQVLRTSVAHLLDGPAMQATATRLDGEVIILLTRESGGGLEVAILPSTDGTALTRLAYLTLPHRRPELERLAARLGLPLADDSA